VSSNKFQEDTPLKDESMAYNSRSNFCILSIAEDISFSEKGQHVLKAQISKSGISVGPGDCVTLYTSGKQLPLLAQIIKLRSEDKEEAATKFKGRYFYWKEELPEQRRAEYKWAKDEIIASDRTFNADIACIENLCLIKPIEHLTCGVDYYFRVGFQFSAEEVPSVAFNMSTATLLPFLRAGIQCIFICWLAPKYANS
jgi:hypothetical protein